MIGERLRAAAATLRAIPRRLRKSEVFALGALVGFGLLAGAYGVVGPPNPPIETRAFETMLMEFGLAAFMAVLLAWRNGPPEEADDG